MSTIKVKRKCSGALVPKDAYIGDEPQAKHTLLLQIAWDIWKKYGIMHFGMNCIAPQELDLLLPFGADDDNAHTVPVYKKYYLPYIILHLHLTKRDLSSFTTIRKIIISCIGLRS